MGVMTSPTLLNKLKDTDDEESWDEFYQLYSTLIVSFCRQRGLPEQMSLDVLQETMVSLLRVIPSFEYNKQKGKFRSFLLRIVDSRMKDLIRRQKKYCLMASICKPGLSTGPPV